MVVLAAEGHYPEEQFRVAVGEPVADEEVFLKEIVAGYGRAAAERS